MNKKLIINMLLLSIFFSVNNLLTIEKNSTVSPTADSKVSYIWSIAKIIIGSSQLLYEFAHHSLKSEEKIDYFDRIKSDLFEEKAITSFLNFGKYIAPLISGSFLIKSGIDDLKKLTI